QSIFQHPVHNIRAGIAFWLMKMAHFGRVADDGAAGKLRITGWHYGLPATTGVHFSRASTDPYYAEKMDFVRKLVFARRGEA
ncbi:MAG: hypothetical protein LBS89_05425, partial [Zoogloeaceae bacterium]|nr:hypothetical protein [Zoogloeaceae bacterium]